MPVEEVPAEETAEIVDTVVETPAQEEPKTEASEEVKVVEDKKD